MIDFSEVEAGTSLASIRNTTGNSYARNNRRIDSRDYENRISRNPAITGTETGTEIKTERTSDAPKLSFEDILTESVKKVNSLQIHAEKKVRDLAIGDVDDISEVVLASSRADTALRLLMEVRNKFLDAYQALSRITG